MKEVAIEKEEIKADRDNEKADAAVLEADSEEELSDAGEVYILCLVPKP